MLSAAGIGSGLDVDSIVSQLMALERRPLDLLQQKKDDIDARVSAYGNLKSALSTFQDAMQNLSTPTNVATPFVPLLVPLLPFSFLARSSGLVFG